MNKIKWNEPKDLQNMSEEEFDEVVKNRTIYNPQKIVWIDEERTRRNSKIQKENYELQKKHLLEKTRLAKWALWISVVSLMCSTFFKPVIDLVWEKILK